MVPEWYLKNANLGRTDGFSTDGQPTNRDLIELDNGEYVTKIEYSGMDNSLKDNY